MKLELITGKPAGKTRKTRCFSYTASGTAPGAGTSTFCLILPRTATTAPLSACAGTRAARDTKSCAGRRLPTTSRMWSRLRAVRYAAGHYWSFHGWIHHTEISGKPSRAPCRRLADAHPPDRIVADDFPRPARASAGIAEIDCSLGLYPVVETPEVARWSLFSDDFPAELLEKYHPCCKTNPFVPIWMSWG
jgi:hypothetical protein